jgi:hypothetical protein
MADAKDIQRLVGKMMVDPGFRHRMARDPGGAAKSEGVDLTAEQIHSFQQNMQAFLGAGADLDKTISAGPAGAAGHAVAVFNQ